MALSRYSEAPEDPREVGPPPLSAANALASGMRFLRRRRSIIFLIVLLCVGAGTFYLFIADPKFAAEAVLLIDPSRVEHDQQPSGPMDTQADSWRLQSQIEVLRSEKVALAVIKNLRLTRDAEFVGSGSNSVGNLIDEWITVRPKSEFELTRRAVKRFEDQLSVTRRNRSYAVQIRFQSVDPKRAALIANAIVDAYIADQMDARYEATRRAAKWLQDRMKELRAQLSAEASERAADVVGENGSSSQRIDSGFRRLTQSSGADTPPQSTSSIGTGRPVNNDRVAELNNQLSQVQVASQAIQRQSFPISEARVITDGMSRCLLNIAKRSLPELILRGVGLASKAAAG
jgi:polysaccharide biosynthesis transport protein